MLATHPLEKLASDLFVKEWNRRVGDGCGKKSRECCCKTDAPAAGALMHDLMGVVAESCDRPVRSLEPVIRRIVNDRSFVCACGDEAVSQQADEMDRQVEVAIDVLEQVRRRAVEAGLWSAGVREQAWLG